MKTLQLFFITSIALLMLAGCDSSNKKKQDNETETAKSIDLPPLSDAQMLCYEDNDRRIVGGWRENYDAFIISVQAKKEGINSFTVEESTAFHAVVGDALVVSNGTSNIRDLMVYSLSSGKRLLEVSDFTGEIYPDDDNGGFRFLTYREDAPMIFWNGATASWEVQNYVPENLFNAQLESTQKEQEDKLFDGLRLAALQKVHVDLTSLKATPLNEYTWQYVE